MLRRVLTDLCFSVALKLSYMDVYMYYLIKKVYISNKTKIIVIYMYMYIPYGLYMYMYRGKK